MKYLLAILCDLNLYHKWIYGESCGKIRRKCINCDFKQTKGSGKDSNKWFKSVGCMHHFVTNWSIKY